VPIDPSLAAKLQKYETTSVQYPGVWQGTPALLDFSPSSLILIGAKGEQAVNYRATAVIEQDGTSRTLQFHG